MKEILISTAILCLLLLTSTSCRKKDTTPVTPSWIITDRQNTGVIHPVKSANSQKAMIVGTTGQQAVEAGLEIMREGGNAMDAILATALGQIAISVGCHNSYAGIMELVYYDAGSSRVYSLDAPFKSAASESSPLTIPGPNNSSGRSVFVPGFMAGVEAAHARFGSVPFQRIFDPAIDLAEKGFVYTRWLHNLVEWRWNIISRFEETRAVFTKEDGSRYNVGDVFKQPALATTLKNVQEHGAAYMYSGAWGYKLVNLLSSHDGRMTMVDLENYAPVWSTPAHTRHYGYDIYSTNHPSVGGVSLIEGLNIMEKAGIVNLPHYSQDANALYRFIRLTRVGSFFRMMFSAGDTLKQLYPELDFSTVSRLSRSTAAFYWDQIQSGHWRELEDRIISEWRQFPNVSHHTDSIVVVDEFGNVAAMSHTINTWSWGFTGFFVDGVSIPDAASHQQKIIAYCGAGNYIYDLLAPAIVLREGRPYLVSGCNGFHIHELTLQHLYNILHHNYYPADSLARGMFEMVDYESNSLDRQYIPRGALSTNILNRLIEMGQPVTLTDEFDQFWIGIRINPDSGLWGAVSDVFSGANSYVTGY